MEMDGDRGRALHQKMRTCVLEGVREMYNQTRQRKRQHLQKKTAEILEHFGADEDSLPEPASNQSSGGDIPITGGTKTYTQEMMSDFCQGCRDA
jgi:hypothetical protein